MSIVVSDRRHLDAELSDQTKIVLLIVGGVDSVAKRVHDRVQQITKLPWRETFLISDQTVLSADERRSWFADAVERYAIIRGGSKIVVVSGPVEDLLLPGGDPSAMAIKRAFSQGRSA